MNAASWKKTGPVFTGTNHVHGVGHCSFTKSPDGKEDWIIYHSKKTTQPGWDRNIRMQPFTWKADGSPDFGVPVPVGKPIQKPSGE
jgi:GH43 family beta-xylosidase